MPAWPEAGAVTRALSRLWRGRLSLAAIDGVTIGCALAAVAVTVVWIAGHALSGVAIGATIAVATAAVVAIVSARRAALPRDVERRAPSCQNLVVTAAELIADPARVEPGIGALVCAHAARRLGALDTRTVFPVSRAVARGLVAAVICVGVIGASRARPLHSRTSGAPITTSARATIAHVGITIHPPDYSGLPDRTLRDPTDIEALVGSRLHVDVESTATGVTLETVDGTNTLTPAAGGFAGDVVAARDGYLALQPLGAASAIRRLIGLVTDVDHPPLVHITKPGRDLFVADGNRHIAIDVQAEDDLGLASVRLAFTKVSGSGEDFTFGEGDVPVTVVKTDDRHWHASADWNLSTLALAPGDMVVYRGIASDRRPGAAPVDSDAFIVQVLTPNQAALGGFSIDDDPNKYALSQRMVILKTERLLAKRSSMPAADYLDDAMGIAAEERQVRAMFVFMLGGEFEDAAVGDTLNEVAEAESEGDLAAGRLHNQARVDLGLATRLMSTASRSLAVPDVAAALTSEKSALDAIQRAFTKDRYLLRALSVFERIDLTRRLGGTLTNIARAPRPAATPGPPQTTALRRLLAQIAAAASDASPQRAVKLTALADDCVKADPSSHALRDVATALGQAATEPAAADGSHPALDHATSALAAIIRAASPDAPAAASPDLRRLDGALADALKKTTVTTSKGRAGGSQ